MANEEQGGRVFFSNTGRSMEAEDEIELTSVGIDIGSSTSHLAFSKIVLERLDTRYIVVERTLLHESEVQLTPYSGDDTIDAEALGTFIRAQYALADLTPEQIDTGALILTGVAVRRSNARAIGDLFSAESGRFVVVSAGDGLEATLAAFGSGAVARSGRGTGTRVLNIDIGGGTSKLALCYCGTISAITAIDIGARVVAVDAARRVVRIEDAGRYFAKQIGLTLDAGSILSVEDAERMAEVMTDHLFAALQGGDLPADLVALHRLPPLPAGPRPDVVAVSGGVAEFFYEETTRDFGDLGLVLARAIRAKLEGWGATIEQPDQGIRATVVGASQYTVQVSGSTIFVEPAALLPLRNLPVIKPNLPFADDIDADAVAASIREALGRLDMGSGEQALAVYYRFSGSASYGRLDAFCTGVLQGLSEMLAHGHPLVLVADSDVGGLIGLHFYETLGVRQLISIDGIALEEFDFIDIGAILSTSGAVPVVIKSLVFPTQGLGRSALDLEKT